MRRRSVGMFLSDFTRESSHRRRRETGLSLELTFSQEFHKSGSLPFLPFVLRRLTKKFATVKLQTDLEKNVKSCFWQNFNKRSYIFGWKLLSELQVPYFNLPYIKMLFLTNVLYAILYFFEKSSRHNISSKNCFKKLNNNHDLIVIEVIFESEDFFTQFFEYFQQTIKKRFEKWLLTFNEFSECP